MKTIVIITKSVIALLVIISISFVSGSFGTNNGQHGLEVTETETPTISASPTSSATPTVTLTPTLEPTDTLPPTEEIGTENTSKPPTTVKPIKTTKKPVITTTKTKKPARTPTPAPSPHPTPDVPPSAQYNLLVNKYGDTIATRFMTPEGFERVQVEEGSFAEYLRNLRLKPDGSPLHYLNSNGSVSTSLVPYDEYHTPAAHAAILDWDMLSSTEQCADTVMHLYADYLFKQERYDEMSYTFLNGVVCSFRRYASGYRYNTNTKKWVYNSSNSQGTTQTVLKIWLRHIFESSNTASMVRYDLQKVSISKMQIGDMFIQEKTADVATGHVVLVCDMIYNPTTGETRFMTLQGSMPAVEAHVMLNAREQKMSPWHNTYFPDGKFISATYWSCDVSKLSRFKTQKAYPNVPELIIPTPSPTPSQTPTVSLSPEASTVPETTLPDVTMPDVTLPDVTLPDVTMPDATLPDPTITIVESPIITESTVSAIVGD